MPGWLIELVDTDRALTVGVFLVVVFLGVKAVVKSWPFLRKFVGLVNTLVGDEQEPGIKVRMDVQAEKLDTLTELQEVQTAAQTTQAEELEKVRAQVQNSHKTNLRDDVDVMQKAINGITVQLKTHLDGCANDN